MNSVCGYSILGLYYLKITKGKIMNIEAIKNLSPERVAELGEFLRTLYIDHVELLEDLVEGENKAPTDLVYDAATWATELYGVLRDLGVDLTGLVEVTVTQSLVAPEDLEEFLEKGSEVRRVH